MKDVIDVLPEAAAIVSTDGTILAANDELAAVFGYSKDEVVGQKIELFVPLDFREKHAELRQKFMQQPIKRDFGRGFCFRGMRKDGSIVNIDVYLGPLNQGDVLVLVRSAKDLEDIYVRIKSLTEKLNDLHK